MPIAITDATLVINNVAVAYVPNSITYNEGLGEATYRAQSSGGGQVQGVYSENVETRIPWIKFSLFNTPENIANLKNWRQNKNTNAITLSATILGSTNFTRNISNAGIVNNYEVGLGADSSIEVEFKGDQII